MFNLVIQQAKSSGVSSTTRRLLLLQATTNTQTQFPVQNFNSIFGGIFGRKKPAEEQKVPPVEEPKKATPAPSKIAEPTKYHKESVKAQKNEEDEDIKNQIRKLDRSGPNNLFGKYQRTRKTLKEKNENLE